MDPDKFQQAWQAQAFQTRITIDANLLLKEVQHSHHSFHTMIYYRDVREVGLGLMMIPLWVFLGTWFSLPWSWYLTVPALVWIFAFTFVDRMRHRQSPGGPGDPLRQSVRESLAQVEHQIWLLRNIFWWYLLPFTVALLAFFAHIGWLSASTWVEAVGIAILPALFVAVLYTGIYYLNQYAVRRSLEPRSQELRTLLENLEDESTALDDTDRQHQLESGMSALDSAATLNGPVGLGRTIFIMILLTAITTIASVAAYFAGRAASGYPKLSWFTGQAGVEYPKLSPFHAVRWQASQPEVQLDDEWFQLVSINDVPASEMVNFSQQSYGNLWQKRFEEDLVEILCRMGHQPGSEVKLVVQSLTSAESRVLEDVPMTAANRWAIKNAARDRASSDPPAPAVQTGN